MLTAQKKLDAIKKFISVIEGPVTKESARPDTSVPYGSAIACIDNYCVTMKPTLGAAFTKSVSFSGAAILDWMDHLNTHGNYDEIRMEFGIYDEYMIDSYALPENYLGRITIFIAPYYQNVRSTATANSSAQLPVYNIGHLDPP